MAGDDMGRSGCWWDIGAAACLFGPRPQIGQTRAVVLSAVAKLGSAVVTITVLAASVRADVRTTTEVDVPPGPDDLDHALEPDPPGERPPETLLDQRVRAGRHWRLETARGAVHAWVPADYDAETAATIVFVHGYWIDVDGAWQSYRLAKQFALAGINAMFIAPEAPSAKWEPIAWPSLTELVATVGTSVDVAMPARRLVAVGHSGAYRVLGAWLANPALDTVVLLDAAYTEFGLLPWVRASPQHRLVNVVYETGRFSDYLHWHLPSTKRVSGLPTEGLPEARILYIKTDVGHWQLVTDGVALPLALRAIDVPAVASAPVELPLGLPPDIAPPHDPSPSVEWAARQPFAGWLYELAY
jgi:hypothetical protein